MATPEPKARVDTLEDMKDVLNTRRSELEAVHGHSGGRSSGAKGVAATAKMQAYREGRKAMTQYNQAVTEKLLSRNQLNGQASSSADATDSTQRGIPADIREDARVFVNPGESSSSMLARVARTNRALQDKVKMLEEEVDKYKLALDSINSNVNDISNESRSTDQQVAILADELQYERENHERARHSLEDKAREVEEQAAELTKLQHASNRAHRDNLELSARIQELNLQAKEQETAMAAARERLEENASGHVCDDRSVGEEGAVVPKTKFEDLEKKLAETKNKLGSVSAALDSARSKANGFQAELSQYKTWSRFFRFLGAVCWSLARAVGLLAFLLFAYLIISEDTLRSRGIDVYRLAH